MNIKAAVVYTFSFDRPDDVDIFLNQCQRLASQGYEPLFPPSIFEGTVIQQWGMHDDNNRINSHTFMMFMQRAMLDIDKKWDHRRWAEEYEKFDEWLKNSNSTWCANKSSNTLFRRFAIEHYMDADYFKDGYCIKNRFK